MPKYESVKPLMILLLLKMEVMPPTSVKSESALLMDNENDLQVKGIKGRNKTERGRNYFSSFKAGAAEIHSNLIDQDGKVIRCFK